MNQTEWAAVISGTIAAGISTVGVVATTLIQRYYEHKRHSEDLNARRDSERAKHHLDVIRDRLERRRDVYARFMAAALSQVQLGAQLRHAQTTGMELREGDDPARLREVTEKINDLFEKTRSGWQDLVRIRAEVELFASSPAVQVAHEVARRALLVDDPDDQRELDEFRACITKLGIGFRLEIDKLEGDLNELTGSKFFHPDFTRPLEKRFPKRADQQPVPPTKQPPATLSDSNV